MNNRGTINTVTGLLMIGILAGGCLYLVTQLRHYTALADTIAADGADYYNSTYQFGLDFGGGWPRLTVVERKESDPLASGVVRRIYFALPTQDAYYINGFAHPLVVSIYTRPDAAALSLLDHPRFLGQNEHYTFIYELWDAPPSDLEDLGPSPRVVARSFRLSRP